MKALSSPVPIILSTKSGLPKCIIEGCFLPAPPTFSNFPY